jgi:hypothetical protein
MQCISKERILIKEVDLEVDDEEDDEDHRCFKSGLESFQCV